MAFIFSDGQDEQVKPKILFRKAMILVFLLSQIAVWGQDSTQISELLKKGEMATSFEAANEVYQRAYTLARQINYKAGVQLSLKYLSELEFQDGNISGALRYLLEEMEFCEKQKQTGRLAEIGIIIGDTYSGEGLYAESVPYYRVAGANMPSDSVFQRLGDVFSANLQPDSAWYYYTRLKAWEGGSNPEAHLNLLHKIVLAYSNAGDHEKALSVNLQILEKMEAVGKSNAEVAVVHNNIGYDYNLIGDYPNAIVHFEKAIELTPETDEETEALLNMNTGIAQFNLQNLEAALIALTRAKELLKKSRHHSKNQIDHLLSNVYLKARDYYNALNVNNAAIKNARATADVALLSDAYYTAAQIHAALYEYQTALDYYQLHLELRDSLRQIERDRKQNLLQDRLAMEKVEKEIRLLLINQEIKDLTIQQLTLEKEKQQLRLDNLELESSRQEQELALLKQEQITREAELENQELVARQTQQQLEIARQHLLAEKKDRELSELTQTQQLQELELQQKEAQLREEEQKSTLLIKDNEINQLELKRQGDFIKFGYGIGVLLLAILGLILAGLLYSRKTNRELSRKNEKIEAQRAAIAKEQEKSDALLLNILPAATAEELKEKGSATPKRYENTTVLFADFVGFTRISEHLPPEDLVDELNFCFKKFDQIVDRYGLEKIKTIGDAYMCVGGLPLPDKEHPLNAARAAREMMDFIQSRYRQKRAQKEPYWQMRIGLHSGPVVAGVVGSKKFVYDIWGDTVNTASRIESNSEPGKINISGDTYHLLKDEFPAEYRGKISAKNKGEVEMYFLQKK